MLVVGAGLSVLDHPLKYPSSRHSISCCDSIIRDVDQEKSLSMKLSKSALHRNFIAEAADAASPAVVNIGTKLRL